MRNKIFILTARAGFPNGFGASSILRKYVKGFEENGYEVSVMLLRPSEYLQNQINFNVQGVFSNSTYEYMGGEVVSPVSRVRRWLSYFKATVRSGFKIIKDRNSISTTVFYSPDYFFSVKMISIICNVLKIRCIAIKTESSYCDAERIRKRLWKFKEKAIYSGFDRMCVISKYLKKQVRDFGYAKEIQILPIVVDENMFSGMVETVRKKEIVYVGTLNYDEEWEALIAIARHIQEKYSEWKVAVIGDAHGRNEVELSALNCIGKLPYDKLAEYMLQGSIMILPRSNQEYSMAGFPIKLGEYLLTGAPVIATDVGEIKDYLKSEKELYLVEPDNINQFLEKLDFVIEHYEEALAVGDAGKQAAIRLFSANQICKMMMED